MASVLRATSNGYTALTICLYPQLEFLQSAARASELPPADVELAFVGRSNVGKSSVLNAVTGRKELARISKTLGYPQVIKVFEVEPGHWIVDLPCCSFAAAPRRAAPGRVRDTWQPMIEGYLMQRSSLREGIQLNSLTLESIDEIRRQCEAWRSGAGVRRRYLASVCCRRGQGGSAVAICSYSSHAAAPPGLANEAQSRSADRCIFGAADERLPLRTEK